MRAVREAGRKTCLGDGRAVFQVFGGVADAHFQDQRLQRDGIIPVKQLGNIVFRDMEVLGDLPIAGQAQKAVVLLHPRKDFQKEPGNVLPGDGEWHGFRIDSDEYTALLRCKPSPGDYEAYVWCYKKDWLDEHMANAENGIRFIDSHYQDKFRMENPTRYGIDRVEVSLQISLTKVQYRDNIRFLGIVLSVACNEHCMTKTGDFVELSV